MSDDEQTAMIRETVAKFVDRELIPLEPQYLKSKLPGSDHPELTSEQRKRLRDVSKELGLWGLDAPEDLGGHDLPTRTMAAVHEELGRSCVPFVLPPDSPNLRMLQAVGTEAQKKRHIEPMLKGDEIWSQLFSEPSGGSDVASLQTSAAKVEGGDMEHNLLALAIDAARAKATVGEISSALEEVYGRYTAQIRTISGVYRDEAKGSSAVEEAQVKVADFERSEGRRPRILVAKMGQDGHDRGQKVIATAFADLGFDVDVGPLFQTPAEVARQAVEADVHVVGVSSLAAGHLTLVPALRRELDALGRQDLMIVVGGVIPTQDFEELRAAGADDIYPPGTVIAEAALRLVDALKERSTDA